MPTPPVNSPVRLKYGNCTSLAQVVRLQQVLYDAGLLLKADVEKTENVELRARVATALSQVARSWDTLENRKRILRGRGLPKPVDSIKAAKFKHKQSVPTFVPLGPNFSEPVPV